MIWTFTKKIAHFIWVLFKTTALLTWVLISILAVVSFLMDVYDEDPKKMADKFVQKIQGIFLRRAFKTALFSAKQEWKQMFKEMKHQL